MVQVRITTSHNGNGRPRDDSDDPRYDAVHALRKLVGALWDVHFAAITDVQRDLDALREQIEDVTETRSLPC